MEIEYVRIPIMDIISGYTDNEKDSITVYSGKLNICSAFQREFIYDDKQLNLVIDFISRNRPLNTICWVGNPVRETRMVPHHQYRTEAAHGRPDMSHIFCYDDGTEMRAEEWVDCATQLLTSGMKYFEE